MSSSDESLWKRVEQRVGGVYGKYTLEAVLGVGGMAAVYQARHRNGNRVAVKMLHDAFALDDDLRARVLREGYLANKVEHPGVVRVIDDDATADGVAFVVMELLEGTTLQDFVEQAGETLSPREAVTYVSALLEVLAAAHARGVVHRDVKPDNVFLQSSGHAVKVLDFGIARLSDGSQNATRTGHVMGTPSYMSPEQARGEAKAVDAQTDVWAAGAILYRLITGHPVHQGETSQMTLILAATENATPLDRHAPHAGTSLCAVVDTALARDKRMRFPSAQSMLDALRAIPEAELSTTRVPPTHIAPTALTLSTQPKQATAKMAAGPTPTPARSDTFAMAATMAGTEKSAEPHDTSAPIVPTKRGSVVVPAVVATLVVAATAAIIVFAMRDDASVTPARPAASIAKLEEPLLAPSGSTLVPPPPASFAIVAPAEPSAAVAVTTPPRARAPGTKTTAAVAVSAAPVASVPAAGPNCNPPYTLTADGTREYKLECYKK